MNSQEVKCYIRRLYTCNIKYTINEDIFNSILDPPLLIVSLITRKLNFQINTEH